MSQVQTQIEITSSQPEAFNSNSYLEMYPSEELLKEFQKCDILYSKNEFIKLTLSCNQLMKKYKLEQDDLVKIKRLTAFSYFQCNFFYKSVSILVDLLKNHNDFEAKVCLSLFEKSTCLNNLVQDIKSFQGYEEQEDDNALTSYQQLEEQSDKIEEEDDNLSTNTSLSSLDSSISQPKQQNYGCKNILNPNSPQPQLFSFFQVLQNAKYILEIEQELIESANTIQNKNLSQIILMILVLEYFNIKDTKKTTSILNILINQYPENPKYKTGLAQSYVQSADIINFEQALKNMQNIDLTDFKQNILFGVEGLFVKNHSQFSAKYLDLIALHMPQLFLEDYKNSFTKKPLQNSFGYFRNNLVEIIKVNAFQKEILDQLTYNPNYIYLDLYFD